MSVLAVVIVLGISHCAGANSFSFSGFASNVGSSIAGAIGLSGISTSGGISTSSSRKSTNTDNVRIVNVSFPEAVKDPILQYNTVLNVTMDYDIYLDSSDLHWYLVVHGNMPGADFPYVTIEITTDQISSSMIPEMRLIHPEKEQENLYHSSGIVCPITDYVYRFSGCYMTRKGTVHTTMRNLSEIAERVRQNKGDYNLFFNNCQDFCNGFLMENGLPTTTTTVSFDEQIMTVLMMFAMMKETMPKTDT